MNSYKVETQNVATHLLRSLGNSNSLATSQDRGTAIASWPRRLRRMVQRREVSTVSVQTESHLIAALIAAGWRVNSQRMWVHEATPGEYTLLEAVRLLR